jgi:cell pole-organizing protein PopZ
MDQPQEPTLADVLAAVNTVAASVHDLATHTAAQFAKVDVRLGQLDAAVATVRAEVATVGAKVDQARADIAAVKVDTAFAEAHSTDLQNAVRRHLDDPNAHGGHAA